MGQKSNPIGMRLQINRTWDSRWFARGEDYGRLLLEDLKIRKFIMKTAPGAAISKVVIERPAKLARISVYAARPGVLIGKKGADIEKLRREIGKMTSSEVSLNIVEIRKPEIDSKLVAQGVADQLERRIAFRRAMKRAVQSALRLGPRVFVLRARGGWAARKSRGPNGIVKGACRCIRCARTWTMPRRRRTPLMVCAASRSGSSRAKSWVTIRWPGQADDGSANERGSASAVKGHPPFPPYRPCDCTVTEGD